MDGKKIEPVEMLKRRLIGMVKFKLMLALVVFGIFVFGIAVEILDPDKVPPRTFESVQMELEELARARQEGRAPDLEQFRQPIDKYWVINYLLPLFGVWMLCKFARRRGRLPVAIFAVHAVLWPALWFLWSGGVAVLDLENPLYRLFGRSTPGQVDNETFTLIWMYVAMVVLGVLVVAFRWLWVGPGWVDRVLRGARRPWAAGPYAVADFSTDRARIWLYASSLACAPLLWWLYGWFDGNGIPGLFTLAVRGLFVVFSLWLMARAQIDLAWPNPGLPHDEVVIEPDPEFDDFPFGA